MSKDTSTLVALPFAFTDVETFATGSHITFGSLDFFAIATGELHLACRCPHPGHGRSLTNENHQCHHDGGRGDTTPPDVEALANCVNALLVSSSTSKDREQVLYGFTNMVIELHRNPLLPSMLAL